MPGSRLERIARPVRGGAFTSFGSVPDGFSLTHGRPPRLPAWGARSVFLRGRRPAAGRLVRNEEVAGSNPVGSTTRNASKSEHNHTGVSPTRETHKLTADPLPAVRVEGEGTPPWPGEGGHAVPVRIRVGARRRIGGTLILRGSSQNVRASPGVPARRNTGMDGGPCGKGAVLLRLLGAEVPGEFDSRTIRLPICSDRPRDRAWNPVSKNGLDRHGGMQSGIRVRCVRAHSSLV